MLPDELRAILAAGGESVPLSGLLRAGTVARYIGLTVRTLQHWRQAGIGPPCIRLGGQWVYPVDGLAAWLAGKAKKAEMLVKKNAAATPTLAADVPPRAAKGFRQ